MNGEAVTSRGARALAALALPVRAGLNVCSFSRLLPFNRERASLTANILDTGTNGRKKQAPTEWTYPDFVDTGG